MTSPVVRGRQPSGMSVRALDGRTPKVLSFFRGYVFKHIQFAKLRPSPFCATACEVASGLSNACPVRRPRRAAHHISRPPAGLLQNTTKEVSVGTKLAPRAAVGVVVIEMIANASPGPTLDRYPVTVRKDPVAVQLTSGDMDWAGGNDQQREYAAHALTLAKCQASRLFLICRLIIAICEKMKENTTLSRKLIDPAIQSRGSTSSHAPDAPAHVQ